MAIKINASVGTLNSAAKTDKPRSGMTQNIARLASGKRINQAADNAAGLAIAVRFAAQIGGTEQSYRNINDGISLAQTGEAAMSEVNDQLQRIRELATQSANASLNDLDRASLQIEVNSLQDEIRRITSNTTFNGVSLLDQQQGLEFQVGANPGENISIDTPDLATHLDTLGLNSIDISAADSARQALGVLDQSLTQLNRSRSEFGAIQNRFSAVAAAQLNLDQALTASRSRIEDADVAAETAGLSRNLILQQSETAMQAQANTARGLVLSLLKN